MKKIIKSFIFVALFAINIVGLSSCSKSEEKIIDARKHSISISADKLLVENDIEVQSFQEDKKGFTIEAVKQMDKDLLSNIVFVNDSTNENVNVEYTINYANNENQLEIIAQENTTSYYENVCFNPRFADNGAFDGTVEINGELINLFDYTDDGIYIDEITEDDMEEDIEECLFFTATIFGVAVWKIALVATAATVVYVTETNPTYVDSLSRSIDETLGKLEDSLDKIIIGGITYALTKATSKAVSIAKSQTQKEYYVALPITDFNVSSYPYSKVGDLLISNYPITKAQAVSNLKKGIDCYTYTATKAKKAMKSAFAFYSIKKDNVTRAGYYPHYHAWFFGNKKTVNGHAMHSFYGDAI